MFVAKPEVKQFVQQYGNIRQIQRIDASVAVGVYNDEIGKIIYQREGAFQVFLEVNGQQGILVFALLGQLLDPGKNVVGIWRDGKKTQSQASERANSGRITLSCETYRIVEPQAGNFLSRPLKCGLNKNILPKFYMQR